MSKTVKPYGEWESALNTADVFARPGVPAWPEAHENQIYWLQSLPEEGGRNVLVARDSTGRTERITPPGFNIRTRVHEYGGRCHLLHKGAVFFVNFADQRLYRQALHGGPPRPVGPESEWLLADFDMHPNGRWLVAVGERPRPDAENENALVAVDVNGSQRVLPLISGGDFYSCPRWHPDGTGLAWIRWDHPSMPWDESVVHEAEIDATGPRLGVGRIRRVAGGPGQSVCQLQYDNDGSMLFARDSDSPVNVSDVHDFWNLYRRRDSVETPVTGLDAEVGYPHWVFGYARYTPLADDCVLAICTDAQGSRLGLVRRGKWEPVDATRGYVGFSQMSRCVDGRVLVVADAPDRGSEVLSIDAQSLAVSVLAASDRVLDSGDVSEATAYRCATRDSQTTHGWLYAPSSQSTTAPSDDVPPLMVLVHGGPTGRSESGFDPLRQFWTTRGFAVIDVNHRGSTGYGRRYRKALDAKWGVIDVDDVVDCVRDLVASGKADPDRVFIRGGSAGGYAVLCALTRYPDVFCAGACYYGIGNLVTLAKTTHKFEARYLDGLLGERWTPALEGQRNSVYFARSPINHIDQIRSPMILFQGSEDKVVPPDVSREVVAALKTAGLHHQYVEYEGEGHGFRVATNRIDALEQEAAFFASVLDR